MPDGVRSRVGVCRLIGCGVLLCWTAWTATQAEKFFEQAQKAEKNGQIVDAYILYSQAAGADPTNLEYWRHAEALRPNAELLNPSPPRPIDFTSAPADATLFGKISDQELEQARKLLPPARLKAVAGRQDFDFRGDSKALWEQLASALHLMVIFDTQYQPTPPLRFQIADADYRDALHDMEAATNSFLVPVNDQLIFIANDTPAKRTDFERTVAVVIPFTETISVQELQEIATSVKGMLEMSKFTIDTQRHLILIRDRLAKVRLAQKVLEDLMRPRAQVAIDVEVLATDRSSALSYGLSLPTAFPLVNFPVKRNLMNFIPSGFSSFATFGRGASLIGIGITTAQMFATVAKSSASTVLQSQMVALDGQQSTLHIGEKYPIVTAGYFGSQGSSLTGATNPSTGLPTPVSTNSGATGTGTLQLSQTSVTWVFSSGGSVPEAASISVDSTSGSLDYNATVVSSSPWLVVNGLAKATGTLPATLTVSPGNSLAALGTGSYQGTVQVSGSDGSVAYLSVTLNVNGGAQNLSVSPSPITLTTNAGGLEVQQILSASSAVGGSVSVSLSGTGLSFVVSDSEVGANTPFTVTVLGNPAGLSAQAYPGVLSLTVGGLTQEVPVSFNIIASGGLQLSQTSVPWSYATGGSLPQSVNISVASSVNSPTFTATASSANSWLLVDGQTTITGNLPAVLTISPTSNLTQLGTGNYTGSMQLTSSDGSIAYFNVNLTVNGGTANGLTVSPNPITLNAPLYGAAVQQTVTVTSTTAGTLAATVSGSGLSVSVPSAAVEANTPISFTLTANPTGLSAQNYVGYLTVTVAGVTQTVEVTFSVGAINSGTNGTGSYAPPPTFNFEDLGLVVKATPHVHGTDEISLDIDVEFELLGAGSNNGIPVIQNRKYESKVTIRTGEWAVLAGLMSATDSRSITGIPGLSAIPLLRSNTHTQDEGQTLIVLKPHLLIEPPTERPTSRAWAGTETRLPSEL